MQGGVSHTATYAVRCSLTCSLVVGSRVRTRRFVGAHSQILRHASLLSSCFGAVRSGEEVA